MAPKTAEAESKRVDEPERTDGKDRSTVTAEVGVGHDETEEVPETVGKYEYTRVPNNDTVEWERIYQPRETGDYPRVAVEYSISCIGLCVEADDEFHVSRSVVEHRVTGLPTNLPHGNGSGSNPSRKVISMSTVAFGFSSFDEALTFVVKLMQGDSHSSKLPPELSDNQKEGYRKWENGEHPNIPEN